MYDVYITGRKRTDCVLRHMTGTNISISVERTGIEDAQVKTYGNIIPSHVVEIEED